MPDEMSDIVVFLPGITGSVLEKNGREVWGPSVQAAIGALLSRGGTIKDLLLEEDPVDVDDLGDGIEATRLVPGVVVLPGMNKIDGYTAFSRRMKQDMKLTEGETYFEFPYDWRRDNRVSARKLQRKTAEWLSSRRKTHPDAKLIFVAHSMGGIVARYFIECLEGWRDTKELISFGTPYWGSLNSIQTLSNGVKKLGILDLTEVCRSFTSGYQLLPLNACLNVDGKLIHLRDAVELPGIEMDRVRAAAAFHEEITNAVTQHLTNADYLRDRYVIRPVVGIDQPTNQEARVVGQRVELIRSLDGKDDGGDGTVPRGSAIPREQENGGWSMFVVARHSSLQASDAVLNHLKGILTDGSTTRYRDIMAMAQVSLDIDDLYLGDEPVVVRVALSDGSQDVSATVTNAQTGLEVARADMPASDDEWRTAEIAPLPPGTYRVEVTGDRNKVNRLQDVFVVAG